MLTAIKQLKQTLAPLYAPREISAIIDLLLEEVCNINRIDRIMNPDRVLTSEQRSQLSAIISQLSTGMPVQYALGYEYFMGRKLIVNKDVLIPRPETAELVDWIVNDTKKHTIMNSSDCTIQSNKQLKILDIGTGSGCIAISLATLINNTSIIATDLSTAALEIARKNAENLNISNIDFIEMDILSVLNASFQHDGIDKFDIIVSNPPYIMEKEKHEMGVNVLKYEPPLALFVPDKDPLLFYRAIANFATINLIKGGNIYFEINEAKGADILDLLVAFGYQDIKLRKDINGKDRMVSAKL